MAAELKPFAINQTAITISCTRISRLKTIKTGEVVDSTMLNINKKAVVRCNRMAMIPQMEIQRG